MMWRSQTSITWNISGILWACLASIACGIGSISFIYAASNSDIGTVSGITSIYPVVTLGLAAIFLGEPLTNSKLAGISIVVIGMLILQK